MADQLTATSGSGTQTTTGTPQSVPITAGFGGGTQASGVQPGTATSLLNSSQGVELTPTALPSVSLDSTTTAGKTTSVIPLAAKPHHLNLGLLGISAVLVVVAIVLFWSMNRSAKNTTE